MRNTKIALAVLALVASTAAMAEGATVYGGIDAGLTVKDTGLVKTNAFGGGGTEMPNFLGFKGSEELEGGIKATYNLETGFNTGTGAFANGGATTNVFGRAANVGLAGEFGSVTLGLQTDAAFAAALGVDPRGMANTVSALGVWGFNTNTSLTGIFNKNAVGYTTPSIGGFQASTTQSLSGSATSDAGKAQSYGATFAMGDVRVGGWQNTIWSDTANAKALTNTGAGAAYTMGATTLNAYYNTKEVYNAAGTVVSNDFSTWSLGATHGVTDKISVNGAYYSTKDGKTTNSTVNVTALNANYKFSNRTNGYLLYAVEKTPTALQTGSSMLGTTAGKTGSIIGVGIKHTF